MIMPKGGKMKFFTRKVPDLFEAKCILAVPYRGKWSKKNQFKEGDTYVALRRKTGTYEIDNCTTGHAVTFTPDEFKKHFEIIERR